MASPSKLVAVSGETIRQLRMKLTWSQTQLANEVGVSKATIANIECGVTSHMREPNAIELAKKLNVRIARIVSSQGVIQKNAIWAAMGLSESEQSQPDKIALQDYAAEPNGNQAMSYVWYDAWLQELIIAFLQNTEGDFRMAAKFRGGPSPMICNTGLWPYRQIPRLLLPHQTMLGFAGKIVGNPDRRRLGLSVRIVDRKGRDWLLRSRPRGNAPDQPHVIELDPSKKWTPCLIPLTGKASGGLYWSLFQAAIADSKETIRPDMTTITRVVIQFCIASDQMVTSAENGEIWVSPIWLGDEQGILAKLPTTHRERLASFSAKNTKK